MVALWHECGLVRPWNDPVKDDRLVATVMAGYDGHRGDRVRYPYRTLPNPRQPVHATPQTVATGARAAAL